MALYETGYKYELSNESGRIYIIDEDFFELKTREFASLVLKSDNCFIIITRESLPAIPYSYKEIYRIKTSGKYHSLERIYPDFNQLIEKNVMVTEDEAMTISEKIAAIDWNNFDTAYGNAAKDIPCYASDGYIPNVAQSLLNLFFRR